MMRTALELSSIDDLLKSDLEGTIAGVLSAGFQNVVVTKILGESDAQFASALTEAGLNVVAVHVQLHQLRGRFVEVVASAKTLDAEWIVIPIVQLDEYGSGWERLGQELGGIDNELGKAGIRLAFHPNKAEFRPDREATGLKYLFEGSGRELDIDFDLLLANQSQAVATEWLIYLANSVPLVTLDFEKGDLTEAHPVFGLWKEARAAAKTSGVKWVVVKDAQGYGDRFERLSAMHRLMMDDGLSDALVDSQEGTLVMLETPS